eukprot:jgi/Picsp_1/6659/NSC_04002-R1_protein fra10ac1
MEKSESRREKEELGALVDLEAYEKHKKILEELASHARGRSRAGSTADQNRVVLKSDVDVLKESYRFIRSEGDDLDESPSVVGMARKYYSRLFREYGIVDLSRYKEGKVGIRWRSAKEVYNGKGQFVCGEGGCDERRGLESFEVPFGYSEAGERKQALVKVRVCPKHALQLNHKTSHKRKRQSRETERSRHGQKKKPSRDSSSSTPSPSSSPTASSDSRNTGNNEDVARDSADALKNQVQEQSHQSSKRENKDLIHAMNERLIFKDLFR